MTATTLLGVVISILSLSALTLFLIKPNQDAKNKEKYLKNSEDVANDSLAEALRSDYDYLQH